MRLEGKVAIVTGAGRGIGRGIALAFAEQGAVVVGVEIDSPSAAELGTALGARGHVRLGDATHQDEVDGAVAEALARHGRIDVLVNNAVRYAEVGVAEATDEQWLSTLDSALTAVFRWCRAVLPPMMGAGRGAIVNLASINQRVANPRLAAYTAAKGGIVALTKQIAVEYGPRGVRCNAISPGLVVTERTMVGRTQADLALDTEPYPVGRLGRPEDVAAAAVFLASDEAGWITGVDLPVDGGLTALAPSALVSPKVRRWWGRAPLAPAGG